MRDISIWQWGRYSAVVLIVAVAGIGSVRAIRRFVSNPPQIWTSKPDLQRTEIPKQVPFIAQKTTKAEAPEVSIAALREVAARAERRLKSFPVIGTELPSEQADQVCKTAEYRGYGMKTAKISASEWSKFMQQYHGVKKELIAWLHQHRNAFSQKQAELMERQIRELRVQRAPTPESPDLAWRGIGVYSEDIQSRRVIRLGGGFMELVKTQPKRAKFELASLIAQGWAPCELSRAENPWTPLLQCLGLGMSESQNCGEGSYSEGGWAVSSAVAAIVAPPNCKIPAFNSPQAEECLGKVGRSIASEVTAVIPRGPERAEKVAKEVAQ